MMIYHLLTRRPYVRYYMSARNGGARLSWHDATLLLLCKILRTALLPCFTRHYLVHKHSYFAHPAITFVYKAL